MTGRFSQKLLWAYALLLLLAAFGYARYDVYLMDGDGTAFLDIAQYLNTGHAALAINAYWNPAYPAVLALAERLSQPPLWRELVVVRYANVLIFALAAAATVLFTRALAEARAAACPAVPFALSASALHLLGLGLLSLSLARELPIAAPRADTLLFVFLLLAAAALLRLLRKPTFGLFSVLGIALGLGYLTKSFAFLPSIALFAGLALYGLTLPVTKRLRFLTGVGLAALLFALLAGPYVLAISRQLGHFSTGESARLNYAFFIDLTPRWHEWYRHDLGHAGGTFVHSETVLHQLPPAVFSYTAHPYGTFPLWFDPAWWTLGIKPHLWLRGHLLRFARNLKVLVRYLLGRPEPLALLGILFFAGAGIRDILGRQTGTETGQADARISRWQAALHVQLWLFAPLAWGALMFLIYLPVDLQDRYLTAPFLLVLLPCFAALRVPSATSESTVRAVSSTAVLLFAVIGLLQTATYLADRRRHTPPAEQSHPGFDPEIFLAAAALDRLGLRPGDAIACLGDHACYTDHYWARLAGTQILAQVDTPDEIDPLALWNSLPDKQAVLDPLRRLGLRYLVTTFPNSTSKPAGWIELGSSDFFAYPLQQP